MSLQIDIQWDYSSLTYSPPEVEEGHISHALISPRTLRHFPAKTAKEARACRALAQRELHSDWLTRSAAEWRWAGLGKLFTVERGTLI